MHRGVTVGVVVPTYNEAEFIGEVIETMPEFVDWVFVVDDCSTDETWTEISARADAVGADVSPRPVSATADHIAPVAGSAHGTPAGDDDRDRVSLSDGGATGPHVVPVRHTTNRGRGGSVKTGYQLALRYDVDVVAVMDGDAQMDPDRLDDLIDPIVDGEADYTKGNRLVNREYCREMSNWRLFGNVLLTLLTKIASGYWGMRDPQNGYTAISATALEQLPVEDLHDDYGFLNHVLIELNVQDLAVRDVPTPAIYGEESSGIRYSTFIPQLSILLLQGFLSRLWRQYGPGTAVD